MIDPDDHALRALADVPAILPRRRGGRQAHVSTMHRWATSGCRGVVLRTLQVGGTRCTTQAWLAEFFEALTAERSGQPAPARTLTQRERAMHNANRRLADAGM